MEERIVCAAIWYKDLELKKEITYCRSKNLDTGIVFAGLRHPHCMYTMCCITGLRSVTFAEDAAGEHVSGFITTKDRFVDREEGAKIALACKQIEKLNYSSKLLYSEDLY